MNQLARTNQQSAMLRPVSDEAVKLTLEQYNRIIDLVQRLMIDGTDYGVIPGTGSKKILLSNGEVREQPNRNLLQPGAEKLAGLFNFYPSYQIIQQIMDWTGQAHGGEPLFFYEIKCELWRNDGTKAGEGLANISSWEEKYRYRYVSFHEVPGHLDIQQLPRKGKSISEFDFAIDKAETGGQYGKPAEYWQKFQDAIKNGTAKRIKRKTKANKEMDAWEIDDYQYAIPNDRIYDQVNTLVQMGQKRSFIKAVRTATMSSTFFTQDMDHLMHVPIEEASYTVEETGATYQEPPLAPRGESKPAPEYKELKKDGMDTKTLVRKATDWQRKQAEDLAEQQGYVFTRKVNEYNEVEMNFIIKFLEGKNNGRGIEVFLQKADLVERVEEVAAQPEDDAAAQEYRDALEEIFLGQVKKVQDLNIEPNGHMNKCLMLDPETCPINHLEGAIQWLKTAIEYAEQQLKQDQEPPKTIGEWARRMKGEVSAVATWGTGMISEFFTQAILHSDNHTGIKNFVPFDLKEVEGLTPNAIYLRLIKESGPERPQQILEEAIRLNLQFKQAKSNTPVKRN